MTAPASPWRGKPFYRTYAVLTLCRILYSHRKGGVVSKPRAARWALRALPPGRRSLVRVALAGARGIPAARSLARITPFIEFVLGPLNREGGPTERREQPPRPFAAKRPRTPGVQSGQGTAGGGGGDHEDLEVHAGGARVGQGPVPVPAGAQLLHRHGGPAAP